MIDRTSQQSQTWQMPISDVSKTATGLCGFLFCLIMAPQISVAQTQIDLDSTLLHKVDVMIGARNVRLEPVVTQPTFVRLADPHPALVSAAWQLPNSVMADGNDWVFLGPSDKALLTLELADLDGQESFQIEFQRSPEPYNEPDNDPALATDIEPGKVETRVFPIGDVDYFVISPSAAGALWIAEIDPGRHEDLVFRWLNPDGSDVRPDLEQSITASTNQSYILQVYDPNAGADDMGAVSWDVNFSEEPYAEPNDTAAQATPSQLSEVIALRLMPRVDRDIFSFVAPGNGALAAEFLELGGHAEPRFRWLGSDGNELRPNFESSLQVAAGETYLLEVRSNDYYWNEQARVDAVRIRVDFSEEPYAEPNDTPAQATPSQLSEVIALRLMPRVDRDIFSFVAPGNGALAAEFLELGGHAEPRFRWLGSDGNELRPNFESSLQVAAGETYLLEVRSNDYYWNEQARVDAVRIRVDFSEEPYAEPNDTPAQATPVEIGETVRFRLMPRGDLDHFAVHIPTSGTLEIELLENGGHPGIFPSWYNMDGTEVSSGNWELPVTSGQILALLIQSDDYYWSQLGRVDPLAIRVRLRRPDGSYVGEDVLADEVELRPWEFIELSATNPFPLIVFRPPQVGWFQLDGLRDGAVLGWRNLETSEILVGNVHALEPGATYGIEIRDPAQIDGVINVTMRIKALGLTQNNGLYPRAPLASGNLLFGEAGQ